MNDIGLMILLQVFLIGLNAVFASAEIAVISIKEAKMAKMAGEGDKRAERLCKLTENPARFLATIQVAITLSGFLGSAFAAENFSEMIAEAVLSLGINVPKNVLETAAVVVITVVLSYFTLVFGELVPKQIAMRKSEKLALALSGIICFMAKIFKPIVWFLTLSVNAVLKLFGIDGDKSEETDSEEEIKLLIDVGGENGSIDDDEKEIIKNLFEFDDIRVGDITIHRKNVVYLCMEDEFEVWKKTVYENRYSYFPVYTKSPDNILGVVSSDEFFRSECKTKEEVLKSAMKKVYRVPEKINADVCFENMKRDKQSFAIVTDEYGGTCGLITITDLVSFIVGKI